MKRNEPESGKSDFTIGGQRVSVSREEVLSKLKGVQPGRVTEHMVLIGGLWYPMKEALALVTGVDRLSFQTAEALRVFKRLHFEVGRKSMPKVPSTTRIT